MGWVVVGWLEDSWGGGWLKGLWVGGCRVGG